MGWTRSTDEVEAKCMYVSLETPEGKKRLGRLRR
jgi:hypothetical protein